MYKALPNCLHVKDSPIAGQGLFATEDIPDDVYLGISHVVVDEEIMRTPLGGFVNHSEDPNCIKVFEEEEWGKIYHMLSLIHILRCRRLLTCRSRWSPYH